MPPHIAPSTANRTSTEVCRASLTRITTNDARPEASVVPEAEPYDEPIDALTDTGVFGAALMISADTTRLSPCK